VQRTNRNCIFCNAAKTEAGIVMSQFGHDGGSVAQIVEASGRIPDRARPIELIKSKK
jgi:hypothetical protein